MTTDRYVVGLDGEGVGRRPHRYTLLAWSNVDGTRAGHLEDSHGLSTLECLEFVTALPCAARVYGYYLGYDWTMMLADLPDRDVYRLLRPELRALTGEGGNFSEVPWKHFRLHYLAGMMRVRNTRTRRRVTIWDVGNFYQCTFVEALRKWQIRAPVDRIANMKAKRSRFTAKQRQSIREYCLDECSALASLVEELNSAHQKAGVPLTRWFGPGSTASVALKQLNIQRKRGEHPPEVLDAASRAFFGGRFEHRGIGVYNGPIYGYDLVSAYPAATLRLQCLEHASWTRKTSERFLNGCKQALVRWRLQATTHEQWWGPLPVRLPRGSIVFPRSGASGWCWRDEFLAARDHWPNVEFCEAWILRSSCKCQPFAKVAQWFRERKKLGKEGRGIVLKLALNSLYGKLAQSVGHPPFASRIWAGMITSATRAALLRAIAQNPEGVLCTATDGIYSTVPLDLDVGSELGQWEEKRAERIVLVRPGIYWTDETVRARGIGRGALPPEQREAILEALAAGEDKVMLPPVTRFGGAKECVYRTQEKFKRSERYGQWYEQPCRISFDPRPKRGPGFALFDLPGVESVPFDVRMQSPEAMQLMRAEELAWGAR